MNGTDLVNALRGDCPERSHLREVEAIADLGSWYADFERDETEWSEKASEILGVPVDEDSFGHDDIPSLVAAPRQDAVRRERNAVFDGDAFDIEYRIDVDGSTRWIHERAECRRDDSGDPVAAIGVLRDITDRKGRERQLDAARKRYRTLIDAAPDPIFVADAETGEIVEANAAAADLRGQPRDELVGLHQTALHPDEAADRYRELFEDRIDQRRTITEFDDGTPVSLTTIDGDRIPVAINTSTVSLDGRTLVHGIFRDVSERRRHETALAGINTASQALLQAETDAEIARIIVDAATDLLDASGSCVYRYDSHSGELVAEAYSERLDDALGHAPRVSPGEGVVWRVFTDREPARFDDVRTADGVDDDGTPIRSELLVPLGDHGVFLVGDTSVGAFDDTSEGIAETLASTAEAAFDRVERTRTLRERERESQGQAERLERINQLNDEIRTIMQGLIRTHSRDAIAQQVCDSLISLDRFAYAWIGTPDHATSEIRVSAQAGSPQHYPEAVSLDFEPTNMHPSVRAVRERTTITVPRIATAPHRLEWRDTALRHEFQSVISVPLIYDEFLYGVVTVYSDRPDAFDDRTESVLTELGELVGYALNASEQRDALLGGGAVDVTFDLTGVTDLFVEFADRLSADIRIENITPRSEGMYLVHFQCDDAERAQLHTVADALSSVTDLRVISETDRTVYEAVVIGECLVTTLATIGANVRSVMVTGTHCRIRASLPDEREKQTLVRHLKDRHPDIDVAIHQQTTTFSSDSWLRLLDCSLTARQRDILATAYYSGFYDQRRKRTGTEIADSLGISQPAFSTRLRAAQRNLLSTIFGDGTGTRSLDG
ncbi:GAF domain-containing protein [Haloplanus salilacus]|uniref:GAF domain-containing protein n=1 Tax=Haloplanus salilacus TaxID=2949994 RepID=UPI0030D21203